MVCESRSDDFIEDQDRAESRCNVSQELEEFSCRVVYASCELKWLDDYRADAWMEQGPDLFYIVELADGVVVR